MEVARLHGKLVDIERDRINLRNKNLSWRVIKDALNENYRMHSRKGAFRCYCCNSQLTMVLNEDKVCFFSHKDIEACAGSKNYGNYTDGRNGIENSEKHYYGKSVLMAYLEGQLKIHGAEVKHGYFYKEELKMVPDIIIQFPNGAAVWSVDYITGTRSDNRYHQIIKKRKEAYEAVGIQSYFFIDYDWYAPHPNGHTLSLFTAERVMGKTTRLDEVWNTVIEKCVADFSADSMIDTNNYELVNPIQVGTLVYVQMNTFTAHITRFFPVKNRTGGIERFAYMPHDPVPISLEAAVSLNVDKTEFNWTNHNEESLHRFFQGRCQLAFNDIQEAEKQKEADRLKRHLERLQQEKIKSIETNRSVDPNTSEQNQSTSWQRISEMIKPREFIPYRQMTYQEKIHYYYDLIERCKSSERLHELPSFYTKIERAEVLLAEWSQAEVIDGDPLYAMMENMKHALLQE